jgi:3-hydroxyacyl-[acyl-carrier-protein] dehydratase
VRIVTGNPGIFFLASIEKVKFRRQVRPGEEIRMVIQNLRVTKATVRQAGKAYVGEELAAEAEWFALIGETKPA